MNILLSLLLFAMSDANALIEARAILGPAARTYKVAGARPDGLLEYRIVCEIAGKDPIIPGIGISWDAALKSIDRTKSGPRRLSVQLKDGYLLWSVDGRPFGIGEETKWDSTKGGSATGEGMLVFSCNP